MKHKYLNFANKKDLIEGVTLRKLINHQDSTGNLVETLREDWRDVFNQNDFRFAMSYLSTTPSGTVRDKDKWHVHQFQKDRFICISGRIVTAIYDPRRNSPTRGKLNLFLMGPQAEDEMYLVVIPEGTYHGFMVVSPTAGQLLNFPTQLYNKADEGRVTNKEFDWRDVKDDFGIK